MSLKGRSLLNPLDFSPEETESLFALAGRIMDDPAGYAQCCRGHLLATMFYEPSTRTRLSFEAAMLRLGGAVIGFADAASSSASKGESIADTIRMVSAYADIAVMRHPKEGAPRVAQAYASIPIVNAGDGGHHHPTQTLTDLFTIQREKKQLSDLTIGLCGDLKFGRTVHSLIEAMARYPGIRFVLISPEELVVPEYVREGILRGQNVPFTETRNLAASIQELDALYMTRVQRERFFNEEDYIRLKDSYILDMQKLKNAKTDMMILHPLPRVNEIDPSVDADPRAFYFKQARNGMFVRMALITALLGIGDFL